LAQIEKISVSSSPLPWIIFLQRRRMFLRSRSVISKVHPLILLWGSKVWVKEVRSHPQRSHVAQC
jgi:hypothetical protein